MLDHNFIEHRCYNIELDVQSRNIVTANGYGFCVDVVLDNVIRHVGRFSDRVESRLATEILDNDELPVDVKKSVMDSLCL